MRSAWPLPGEIEPAGYGIAFEGGSRHELVALDRYLKALAPDASTPSPTTSAPGAQAPAPGA